MRSVVLRDNVLNPVFLQKSERENTMRNRPSNVRKSRRRQESASTSKRKRGCDTVAASLFFGGKKMQSYVPDLYVGRFSQITPERLVAMGIRCVLTDLDETLVGHGEHRPTQEVLEWVRALKDAGITVCILSNNSESRVAPFAREADMLFLSKAKKPSARRIRLVLDALDLTPEQAVLVGDQLYTDIGAAKNLRIRSILVDPIVGNNHHVFVDLRRIVWERKLRQTLRKDL